MCAATTAATLAILCSTVLHCLSLLLDYTTAWPTKVCDCASSAVRHLLLAVADNNNNPSGTVRKHSAIVKVLG